jgi:hypothetical protein
MKFNGNQQINGVLIYRELLRSFLVVKFKVKLLRSRLYIFFSKSLNLKLLRQKLTDKHLQKFNIKALLRMTLNFLLKPT